MYPKFIVFGVLCLFGTTARGQALELSDAFQRSTKNYHTIKAKEALVEASVQHVDFQKSQYLPDVTALAQQSFGTINAQNGPMYAYRGLGAASTSMPLAEQNWNSAFGSLYLANVNWDLFTFGRLKSQVSSAQANQRLKISDLDQEIFQHQIKVGATYLNLIASQRIKYVQERNHYRAKVFFEMTASRAHSGLIPEVDASLAKAEVSNALSAQIKAYDKELHYSKQLAVLMGEPFQHYQMDSVYNTSKPYVFIDGPTSFVDHPAMVFQQSRIDYSIENEKLAEASRMPTLSVFGVIQGRGSGFDWNYVQENSAFSSSYLKGVGIDRGNYLLGFNLSWNLTNLFRYDHRRKEQYYITQSFKHDYKLMNEELLAQDALAKAQFRNAEENLLETKTQLESASLAYKQHTALYENGLTTLVDFTQALYTLNRAEIAYEIAQNNIWQALLLQAAAQGDLNLILNASQK